MNWAKTLAPKLNKKQTGFSLSDCFGNLYYYQDTAPKGA